MSVISTSPASLDLGLKLKHQGNRQIRTTPPPLARGVIPVIAWSYEGSGPSVIPSKHSFPSKRVKEIRSL